MTFTEKILIAEGTIYLLSFPCWIRIFYKVIIRHFPEGLSRLQWFRILAITFLWPVIVPLSYHELVKKQSQKPISEKSLVLLRGSNKQ